VSTNNHTNSEADQAMENMKAAIIELDKLIAEETDKNTLTELQELKSKLLQASMVS